MTRPRPPKYQLGWTGDNVAALVALAAILMIALMVRRSHRSFRIGREIPVDAQRVRAAAERINPNAAGAASLRRLPGIGPKLAGAIVDYRRRHGPESFRDANDLENVRGIGPALVGRVGKMLRVSASPPATRAPGSAPAP